MKEHCLKALWLCRCVQACLMLGVWPHKWGGVLGGVRGCRNITELEWWRYRAEQEVWRYLQSCEYNAPTWQTDTGQRPRLRI